MKSFIAIPALAGATAASTTRRGGPCSPLESSTVPVGFANPLAWERNSIFDAAALGAETPENYERTVANAHCAVSSPKYMLYVAMDKYDPEKCASVCSQYHGCDGCKLKHALYFWNKIAKHPD
jgi:hypothetical protein